MAFFVEGFEDVPVTSNSPRIFPGFLNVGWQGIFTFELGRSADRADTEHQ